MGASCSSRGTRRQHTIVRATPGQHILASGMPLPALPGWGTLQGMVLVVGLKLRWIWGWCERCWDLGPQTTRQQDRPRGDPFCPRPPPQNLPSKDFSGTHTHTETGQGPLGTIRSMNRPAPGAPLRTAPGAPCLTPAPEPCLTKVWLVSRRISQPSMIMRSMARFLRMFSVSLTSSCIILGGGTLSWLPARPWDNACTQVRSLHFLSTSCRLAGTRQSSVHGPT